jgi:hypothetical protein
MTELRETDHSSGDHHDELHVEVSAPREPHPRDFTFPDLETVGDAARHAATDFGYQAGNPSFANERGEVLDRNQTLRAAQVHDGAKLEIVDVGGGV